MCDYTLRRFRPGDEAALRRVWKAGFDDTDEYIDAFFAAFAGPDSCVLAEADSIVVSAMYLLDGPVLFPYRRNRLTSAYAYALATSEENASGGTVVTAPTCGSSGVMPAVLYHLSTSRNFLRIRILRALATAGLFGNVAKTNSSISGAEVGCQGEVGVACAMAAAAACQLFGGTPSQIEYAAEMGLEHHLGLTCDPVCGLVQVPCIERNAIAAARAFDANAYATLSDGSHMVSFDKVVEVMNETGHALPSLYRETSEGGLAKRFKR